MTSSKMETVLSGNAVFSMKHLLDHQLRHHHHQQQQGDDAAVLQPAELYSPSSTTIHDDPVMGTTSDACLVADGEMPLTSLPQHGAYDMPDVVQGSVMYDHDNSYARWLQSSSALDCYSGLHLHYSSHLPNCCIVILQRIANRPRPKLNS